MGAFPKLFKLCEKNKNNKMDLLYTFGTSYNLMFVVFFFFFLKRDSETAFLTKISKLL